MLRTRIRLAPLVLILLAACSRHATYGRPLPRDTVPTTNEPRSLRPPERSAVPPRDTM
jgi:hypothetical protein